MRVTIHSLDVRLNQCLPPWGCQVLYTWWHHKRMTDQPHLPTDLTLKILSQPAVKYDNIIDTLKRNRNLSDTLNDRSFWLRVLEGLAVSDYEWRWIDTLSLEDMKGLVIKWQAQLTVQNGSPGCSKGAERYVSVTDVFFDAYSRKDTDLIDYLHGVCYDPVGICKALGYLGDDSVSDMILDNGDIEQCRIYAAMGMIMNETDKLFTKRLILEAPSKEIMSLVSMCVEYNNPKIYEEIQRSPGTRVNVPWKVQVYAMVYNGWTSGINDTLIRVYDDDVDEISSRMLKGVDILYIQSIDMIDRVLRPLIGVKLIYWSLLSTLDGTPERLALLKHLNIEKFIRQYPYTTPNTSIELIKYMYTPRDQIPQVVKDQVVTSVLATSMEMHDKVRVLLDLNVLDLSIIEEMKIDRNTAASLLPLTPNHIDKSDRHLVDMTQYLIETSGIPNDRSFRGHSIEMLGAVCESFGETLDDTCRNMISKAGTDSSDHDLELDIISYYYDIRGYTLPVGQKYFIAWTDDIDVCVSMRESIYVPDILERIQSMRYRQILVGLGIANGQLDEKSTLYNTIDI